ncbi:MAG: hypothetical protein J6A89_08330 [Clostridia bacterium]|nr:hypothetical protein [Clostridia bacterium]
MKKNKLIVYKESTINKISKFLKNMFHIANKEENQVILDNANKNLKKENFIDKIVIKENKVEKVLKELKIKYENGDINEDEMSLKDMDRLIKMYKDETEKLNKDTEKRKIRISKMLNKLNVP